MNSNTSVPIEDPTHEEIALCAFLAWEKDGRQPGREMNYWLAAETELREARRKKAEAAAKLAAQPWPRSTTTTASVKRPAPSASAKLNTAMKRNSAPATKRAVRAA